MVLGFHVLAVRQSQVLFRKLKHQLLVAILLTGRTETGHFAGGQLLEVLLYL